MPRTSLRMAVWPKYSNAVVSKNTNELVLALFTVGDVYASLCKKGAYAPFSAQRRSRALFWL